MIEDLQVLFNLQNGTYRPQKKPNDRLLYIYSLSNHPKFYLICEMELILPQKKPNDRVLYIYSLSNHIMNVIKQISNSIEERLSKKSSNEEIFNTAKCEYEEKKGFKVDLKYTKNQRQKPKTRIRNITWFNPPFHKAVSTNVAKISLSLINRHFPKFHILHKNFQ